MLGIFFAIAFCPHRFIYFFTMIELSVVLPASWNWILPVVFGIATGLPIMIIAWLISYSAISIDKLTERMHSIQKWIRYISAALFIGFGIYLCVHIFAHDKHCHSCDTHTEHVCHDEHCHHD
jgi:threonine/homoserine/homoserine lactone efflux protein